LPDRGQIMLLPDSYQIVIGTKSWEEKFARLPGLSSE
jgi:hypothetical protein